jgi:hypothetical protein
MVFADYGDFHTIAVPVHPPHQGHPEADMRLIAAAPDMASLLERCRDFTPPPVSGDIDAMLARIKGES